MTKEKKVSKKQKEKEKETKDEQSGSRSSKWSEADDTKMIEKMTQQKAEGYWGDNNPKPTVWGICLTALAGSELESSGAPKNLTTIKS
jgi:hypothetical protein